MPLSWSCLGSGVAGAACCLGSVVIVGVALIAALDARDAAQQGGDDGAADWRLTATGGTPSARLGGVADVTFAVGNVSASVLALGGAGVLGLNATVSGSATGAFPQLFAAWPSSASNGTSTVATNLVTRLSAIGNKDEVSGIQWSDFDFEDVPPASGAVPGAQGFIQVVMFAGEDNEWRADLYVLPRGAEDPATASAPLEISVLAIVGAVLAFILGIALCCFALNIARKPGTDAGAARMFGPVPDGDSSSFDDDDDDDDAADEAESSDGPASCSSTASESPSASSILDSDEESEEL